MNTMSDLSDHFLIAMPALGDPYFAQTVTYLFQHNAQGAIGIVVNRPLDVELGEILQQMDIKPSSPRIARIPIYLGGPVHKDHGFVLHQPGEQWQSTLHLTQTIAITTSRDILEAIANDHVSGKVLIALGYAGWGPGQLEHEMGANAWLSGPGNADIIFNTPTQSRWRKAAALLGVDLSHLSGQAGHA